MDVCAGPRLDLELLGISQPPVRAEGRLQRLPRDDKSEDDPYGRRSGDPVHRVPIMHGAMVTALRGACSHSFGQFAPVRIGIVSVPARNTTIRPRPWPPVALFDAGRYPR
jgi:hypothetical protein